MQLEDNEKKELLEWLSKQDLGIKFLRWLAHDLCAYNINSAYVAAGGLAPYEIMVFNESKKHLWQMIRRYIPYYKLQEIEPHDKYLFDLNMEKQEEELQKQE